MRLQARAKELLANWWGDRYSFGPGRLEEAASHAQALGGPVLVIASQGRWLRSARDRVMGALRATCVSLASAEIVPGAQPNAPEGDVLRLCAAIRAARPSTLIVVGGGSTIDAAKAAAALAALDGDAGLLHQLFGTGQVSSRLSSAGAAMPRLVAVQTAASSAAHLTKYANVTLAGTTQKKLIVDEALVPARAVFDYDLTASAPAGLIVDGAFDGMAHCLEVYWGTTSGAAAPAAAALIQEVALCGLELLVKYLPAAAGPAGNTESTVALGLGTDLGGYCIMLGGTNGPHLNSFSLVDVASHGRACAILNPYWAVFFAPAIEPQLRAVASVFSRHGHLDADAADLAGRDLGIAIARAMLDFAAALGYPTALGDLPGFGEEHIARALDAARDPQLSMKLRNMPIALDPANVDRYMGSVLRAAAAGKIELVRSYEG